MKTYFVRMLAFGDGERRPVDVSDESLIDNEPLENLLDEIFRLGQNEFQDKEFFSVSMGDVIEIDNRLFMVAEIGFNEINTKELAEYEALPRRDRNDSQYVRRGAQTIG